MKFNRTHSFWLAASCLAALPIASHATTLDVLVVYDSYTRDYFDDQPKTAIRNWVDQVNAIYRNSDVDIELRLVGTQLNNASGSSSSNVLGDVRTDRTIQRLRDELGADFVTQLHTKGSCGTGYVTTNPDYAYNVVGPKCGPLTFAHEIGHNMGLNHSRRQGNTGGKRYPYGLGYGVDDLFATVMAYPSEFSTRRIGKFSNPRHKCSGVPCGVPEGRRDQADAAQAINNARSDFARFRPTKIDGTDGGNTGGGSQNGGIISNGDYLLQVKSSGKCAEVEGSSTAYRADIQQWSCHGAKNQRWTLTHVDDGYYEIKSLLSGRCINVEEARTSDGADIYQASCSRKPHQQFRILKNEDGSLRFIARHSDKAMGVMGSSESNGRNLHQWHWWGGDNQRWSLKRL